MALSPIATIHACQQADAELRRFLRQHGQRVARSAPAPRSALECLMSMTGCEQADGQNAIASADALGLVVDLGQGMAHLTTKGRSLAASPTLTWGGSCAARGRLTPHTARRRRSERLPAV